MSVADRVTVSVGVTRNLGNYNNVKLQADLSTTVKEDESLDEAFVRAWAKAEAEVEKQLSEYEE